jgi:hypothetical protein
MPSKPKILVLMSDNRPLSADVNKNNNFMSFVAYINKQYCSKYGYDFKYIIPYYKIDNGDLLSCIDLNTRQLRHSSYSKIASVRANIEKYDYVVYIDSDCCFMDFNKSVEQVIAKYKNDNIIFQSNVPYNSDLPCAGFFIIKHTPDNITFLDKWYKTPTPLESSIEWKQTIAYPNKFRHYNFSPGNFWEQDILWVFFVTKQIQVNVLDDIAFEEIPGQYLRHLCAVFFGNQRDGYFKNIVHKLIASGCPAFDHEINAINCEHIDTSTIYD